MIKLKDDDAIAAVSKIDHEEDEVEIENGEIDNTVIENKEDNTSTNDNTTLEEDSTN